MNAKVKYLKDEDGSIISPVVSVSSIFDTDNKPITDMKTYVLNLMYPIGSIYFSVSSTSPQTLFGGTWEQLKDRFLLAAGSSYTAGNTGGSSSHSHSNSSTGSVTLTSSHIPSHTHTYLKSSTSTGGHSLSTSEMPIHTHYSNSLIRYQSGSSEGTGVWLDTSGAGGSAWRVVEATTENAGSSNSHSHSISTSSTNTGSYGTSSPSSHSHTVYSTGSSSSLPPYLVIYVWKRTA